MFSRLVDIEHCVIPGMLYMGESEAIWNKFLNACFVGSTGHCAYRIL
jgi:hypothetical protein